MASESRSDRLRSYAERVAMDDALMLQIETEAQRIESGEALPDLMTAEQYAAEYLRPRPLRRQGSA